MAAETFIAFYGVKYSVGSNEIDELERRVHPKLIAARQHSLQHYWGRIGPSGAGYSLLIGARLGILGLENEDEVQISRDELFSKINQTDLRLQSAGLTERPGLLLEREPE